MDDGRVSDIKRGGAARNAKIAGLGAGMAGRAALGFGKRLTGILLFLAVIVLKIRNELILDGSDNVIQVTLPFLILADSYRHFTYPIHIPWRRPRLTGSISMVYASAEA